MGSIAFRASHVEIDLSILGNILDLPVFFSWRAGEPRVTPQGNYLPGMRDRSYWCTRIEWTEPNKTDEFVLRVLNALKQCEEWRSLVANGVRAEFYVCLSPDGTNYVEFSAATLEEISTLGIQVQIEAMASS